MNKKDLFISIVIPLYNARDMIGKVLDAVYSQDYPQECLEVIVVNDGSTDGSLDKVQEYKNRPNLIIIDQPNAGAVSATNKGFQSAKGDIICSIDSDVVIEKNWLKKILEEFRDPGVAAVQGYYKTPEGMNFIARMAGYDMEKRYDDMTDKVSTQVNTGNTAYRKTALDKVGLFDSRFIYAYDNDMAYRLVKAGYQLILKKEAISEHYWKASFKGYMKQQFWSGYGRLQVIHKHKSKFLGDTVSGPRMVLQVPATLLSFFMILTGFPVLLLTSQPHLLLAGLLLMGTLLMERFSFALSILKKQKDLSSLGLPFVHLLRNLVWCWAFIKWNAGEILLKKCNKYF